MHFPQFHWLDLDLSGEPRDPLKFVSWVAIALALLALALAGWVVVTFT